MKPLLSALLFVFTFTNADAQVSMWSWIKGDSISSLPPVAGDQGIPALENSPAGAYNCIGWVDNEGMFWSFGGSGSHGWRGDLWRFNPNTLEWTWMKGTQEGNNPGSYGEMGVPSETNSPPSRGFGVANWTDLEGNLWLYGGISSYPGAQPHVYTDLWKYDVESNMWTWINGSPNSDVPPVYSMPGVPSQDAHPGSRSEMGATWVDLEGNLWLFGGGGDGIGSDYFLYNDLWKYDIELNQWAFIRGQTYSGPPSVYGTQGVSNPSNEPSGRMAYGSWVDSQGNFWMMGGNQLNSGYNIYNDLWRYNPNTNEWTWMKGASETGDPGYYGNKGIASLSNNPPARFENRANWIENDKLYMFGGYYSLQTGFNQMLNDLWVYDIATNAWTWLSGDTLGQPPLPIHGEFGIAALENKPGGRMGAIGWYNGNNEAYIFGGYEYNPELPSSARLTSEIWKYAMDPVCCPLSMEDRENYARFEAYPNPASEFINLRMGDTNSRSATLLIFNTVGQIVHSVTLYNLSDHYLFNIPPHLANGIYMFTLISEGYKFNQKVSVVKE